MLHAACWVVVVICGGVMYQALQRLVLVPPDDHRAAVRSDGISGIEVVLILVAAALTSVVFGVGGMDLAIEHACYDPGHGGTWRGASSTLVTFMYTRGPMLGILVGIASAVLAVGAIWLRPWRRRWREALAVALSLAIGPGLIVNLACKDHLGRPRPREVVGLGGDLPYVQPATRSEYGGHSFPSGHAAAGFSLCSLFIVLRRRRPRMAWIALIAALGYGGLLGYARISVGAHFPSDVLWSLWICYATAAFVWAGIRRWLPEKRGPAPSLAPAPAGELAPT